MKDKIEALRELVKQKCRDDNGDDNGYLDQKDRRRRNSAFDYLEKDSKLDSGTLLKRSKGAQAKLTPLGNSLAIWAKECLDDIDKQMKWLPYEAHQLALAEFDIGYRGSHWAGISPWFNDMVALTKGRVKFNLHADYPSALRMQLKRRALDIVVLYDSDEKIGYQSHSVKEQKLSLLARIPEGISYHDLTLDLVSNDCENWHYCSVKRDVDYSKRHAEFAKKYPFTKRNTFEFTETLSAVDLFIATDLPVIGFFPDFAVAIIEKKLQFQKFKIFEDCVIKRDLRIYHKECSDALTPSESHTKSLLAKKTMDENDRMLFTKYMSEKLSGTLRRGLGQKQAVEHINVMGTLP